MEYFGGLVFVMSVPLSLKTSPLETFSAGTMSKIKNLNKPQTLVFLGFPPLGGTGFEPVTSAV
jgi:predicted nucleotidyltransferase